MLRFLEKKVWSGLPRGQAGRRLTRAEEDEILGYGPGRCMTVDSSALIAAPTLAETSLVFMGRRGRQSASE